MASKTYNIVSLFSGAMGLDIGLEQTSRFNVLASVEKEPAFCDTIRVNKPQVKLFPVPIENLDPLEVLDAIGHRQEMDPEVLDFSPRKKRYLAMIPGRHRPREGDAPRATERRIDREPGGDHRLHGGERAEEALPGGCVARHQPRDVLNAVP